MSSHGGPRPGAGRKPGSVKPQTRRRLVAVRLDDAEMARALSLGHGNASRGIRTALATAPADPTP